MDGQVTTESFAQAKQKIPFEPKCNFIFQCRTGSTCFTYYSFHQNCSSKARATQCVCQPRCFHSADLPQLVPPIAQERGNFTSPPEAGNQLGLKQGCGPVCFESFLSSSPKSGTQRWPLEAPRCAALMNMNLRSPEDGLQTCPVQRLVLSLPPLGTQW